MRAAARLHVLCCLGLIIVAQAFLAIPKVQIGRGVYAGRAGMRLHSVESEQPAPESETAVAPSSGPEAQGTESGAGEGKQVAAGGCPGFPKCDGAYREKGCDGSGIIQGGIATVPGMGWWPIKAYRPCPSATEAGYGYKRKGQTFGELAEGRPIKKKSKKKAASDK